MKNQDCTVYQYDCSRNLCTLMTGQLETWEAFEDIHYVSGRKSNLTQEECREGATNNFLM